MFPCNKQNINTILLSLITLTSPGQDGLILEIRQLLGLGLEIVGVMSFGVLHWAHWNSWSLSFKDGSLASMGRLILLLRLMTQFILSICVLMNSLLFAMQFFNFNEELLMRACDALFTRIGLPVEKDAS